MKKGLKRVTAFALALALSVSASALSFAATGHAKLDKLVEIKAILGDGKGVNGEDTMQRYRSAAMMIRLMGLEDEMMSYDYKGKENFKDAEGLSEYMVRLLAYLKNNPQLGVIGLPDGTFQPMKEISAKEHTKLMLEALGYKFGTDYTWDTVAELAVQIGLAPNKEAVENDPLFNLYDVANFTYDALSLNAKGKNLSLGEELGYVVKETVASIKSAKVTNTNEVTVTLNGAIDPDKATIRIKKGAAIYSSTTKWDETKSVATITTAIALPASEYTVEVSGLTEQPLTTTINVEAEKATSIEIPSTTVELKDGATIDFVVKNQYGKDMKINGSAVVSSAYNMTQGNSESIVDNAGAESKLDFDRLVTDAKAKLGDKIRVIITYAGLTAQEQLTVVEVSKNATIAFGEIAPLEGASRITAGDTGLKLPYTMFDQFGKETKLSAHSANADGSNDIETIDGITFVSSNPSVLDVDSIAVDSNGQITFNVGSDGTAVVTALINSSGNVSSFTVVVNKAGTIESVQIAAQNALIAGGETAKLDVTITDQYGVTIAKNDARISGLTLTSSNQSIVKDANLSIKDGKLVAVTEAAGSGTVTITVKNGTTTVGTVTLNIEVAARPTQITKVEFPSTFEANAAATKDMKYENLTVIDQYGRNFKLTNEQINVVAKDGSANIITISGADFSGSGSVTFAGTSTVGTEVFTISIDGVAGASIDLTLNTVASSNITSYTIEPIKTIYKGASHKVDLTLIGKTSDGKQVVLIPGKTTFSSTSNAAVATVATVGNVTTVTGVKEGTATITLWDGTTKLADITVTVSEEAPYVETLSFKDTVETTVGIGAGNTADLSDDLEIKDQYGIAYSDTGFWTTSDASKATVSNGVVTGVAAGEVTIGYVSSNGKVVTTTLTVQ